MSGSTPVDQAAIQQERDSGNLADRVGCIACQLARLCQGHSGTV